MEAREFIKSRIIEACKILDFEKYTVEQIRQEFTAMTKQVELPHGTTADKVIVADYLPVEWVKAANVPEEKEQVILYFHGGGLTIGSCDTHRNLAAIISGASGVRVLLQV